MREDLYDDVVERTKHQDTIDHLAKESGLPVGEIGRIYEAELLRLKADARVKDYLPVLLIRKVKDTLKRR
jgi:Protein of unknown function (DUF3562)